MDVTVMPETSNVLFGIQRLVVVDGTPIWIPARAITLYQPWAYLMVALPDEYRKNVENRRPGFSSINFRGPVWVHASGKLSRANYEAAMAAARGRIPTAKLPTWEEVEAGTKQGLARSAIVGRMTITDYVGPTATPNYGWHFPFHHGFVTQDALPIPAVPCPGHLGFWRIDNDVAKLLAYWAQGLAPSAKELAIPMPVDDGRRYVR